MNLFLINETEHLTEVCVKGNKIVEFHDVPEKNRTIKKFYLYNPEANTKFEILPNVRKNNIVTIINGVWKSKDLYFSSTKKTTNKSMVNIQIHKYSVETNEDAVIFEFEENRSLLNTIKQIKIFILNDTNILIQEEVQKNDKSSNRMGSIEFKQVLINLESGNKTEIIEANFINNGINTIIPISESKLLLKTGFSYLEDERLDQPTENQALIESVFITTTAKLIADITLMSESMDMEMIASAYFERHISLPRVNEDYAHFSITNINTGTSQYIFYNVISGDTIEYENKILDVEDVYSTHVLNNIPYVRVNNANSVDFLNLKKYEIDVSFYNEDFICQIGRLFLLYKKHKRHDALRIYNYPKLKLILDEKKYFYLGCQIDDNYYIYINR